jgi:exosortase/archaeosortase family protein
LKGPDRPITRFVAWLSIATAVSVTLYFPQLSTFFAALNGRLDETFGTAFPAIPMVALLSLLFLLRWGDLRSVLGSERGLRSGPKTRALGLGITLIPLIFTTYSVGSLELSAVSLILVFYGTSLIVNPMTMRIMFPYAVLYATGVTAPAVLQSLFGEPFTTLASYLSAGMASLSGVPVTWQGDQFSIIPRIGTAITGTVTPGCSSILSVTTFLGLLGLMQFDMKREPSFTLKLAVVGSLSLVLLNSVRIMILIWAGYEGGPAALWALHNWIGYGVFLAFYLVVLYVYSRARGRADSRPPTNPNSFKSAEGT